MFKKFLAFATIFLSLILLGAIPVQSAIAKAPQVSCTGGTLFTQADTQAFECVTMKPAASIPYPPAFRYKKGPGTWFQSAAGRVTFTSVSIRYGVTRTVEGKSKNITFGYFWLDITWLLGPGGKFTTEFYSKNTWANTYTHFAGTLYSGSLNDAHGGTPLSTCKTKEYRTADYRAWFPADQETAPFCVKTQTEQYNLNMVDQVTVNARTEDPITWYCYVRSPVANTQYLGKAAKYSFLGANQLPKNPYKCGSDNGKIYY